MGQMASSSYWAKRSTALAQGKALLDECPGLKAHHVRTLYTYFRRADKDGSEWISVLEFLMFFDIERTVFAVKAFTHMDADGDHRIDFGEFVKATWGYVSLSKEGLRTFAFSLYDLDNSGSIEKFEVEAMVHELYGSNWKTSRLAKATLKKIQSGGRQLTCPEFVEFSKSHPAMLFPAFQLQRSLQKKLGGSRMWEAITDARMVALGRTAQADYERTRRTVASRDDFSDDEEDDTAAKIRPTSGPPTLSKKESAKRAPVLSPPMKPPRRRHESDDARVVLPTRTIRSRDRDRDRDGDAGPTYANEGPVAENPPKRKFARPENMKPSASRTVSVEARQVGRPLPHGPRGERRGTKPTLQPLDATGEREFHESDIRNWDGAVHLDMSRTDSRMKPRVRRLSESELDRGYDDLKRRSQSTRHRDRRHSAPNITASKENQVLSNRRPSKDLDDSKARRNSRTSRDFDDDRASKDSKGLKVSRSDPSYRRPSNGDLRRPSTGEVPLRARPPLAARRERAPEPVW